MEKDVMENIAHENAIMAIKDYLYDLPCVEDYEGVDEIEYGELLGYKSVSDDIMNILKDFDI